MAPFHGVNKLADLATPLQPHQQRVVDKLRASGGLLVAHGIGSGKTLSSIAAADALGLPLDAVVPAPLVANYHKEMAKHVRGAPPPARVRSYERAVRDGGVDPNALVVMDEAHRARNAGTLIARDVAGQAAKAKARLLLTGTPVYNQPHDLATLLNTAAGRRVLPDDPAMFRKAFVGEEKVQAPLLARLKGRLLGHPVDAQTVPKLLNRERLVSAAKGYVDVHAAGGAGYPSRVDEVHRVPLSAAQHALYKFHEGSMPWYLRAKVRAGLPMTKAEATELNSFQGALRQVSNTPRPYRKDLDDDAELEHTPKINQMVAHLRAMHRQDPNFRGVVYSNYLDAGLHPMSRALDKAGIKHHLFTGEVPKAKRDAMVKDYNAGRVPVLLVSGAGSEGLDLKGTKAIQLMEPHWNESRIDQVIGRGIRYQSHAHLPPGERKVKVMHYASTLPEGLGDKAEHFLFGEKSKRSIEQYLTEMAGYKQTMARQIRDALQEASDAGPLAKRAEDAAATTHGVDPALMAELARRIGDTTLGAKGRARHLAFDHPADLTLQSPYDPAFVARTLHEGFGGDTGAYADQLRDDLLNAGYAALGDVAKTNVRRRDLRAARGAAWGSLVGSALIPAASALGGRAVDRLLPATGRTSLVRPAVGALAHFATGLLAPLGTATIGYQLGKHTYKPLDPSALTARHVHPLLMPPIPVKAKTKLEIKE